MRRAERIGYLSNLLLLMRQDGEIAPEELALIGEVRQELGISSEEQDEAEHLVEAGRAAWSLASRFSDCIRNLEDLVQLSLVDYTIQAREKEVVVEMARRVGVTQPQLDRIAREAQQRLKESRLSEAAVRCEFCGTRPVAGSRFCTDCGRPLPGVSLTDIGFPA
ncbi:MAG: hypothetical protein FJ125_11070, partial [Deltaproteobacteria bacterium]|nr:hypothetical protein [Deltaproteobacteria bacterium]